MNDAKGGRYAAPRFDSPRRGSRFWQTAEVRDIFNLLLATNTEGTSRGEMSQVAINAL